MPLAARGVGSRVWLAAGTLSLLLLLFAARMLRQARPLLLLLLLMLLRLLKLLLLRLLLLLLVMWALRGCLSLGSLVEWVDLRHGGGRRRRRQRGTTPRHGPRTRRHPRKRHPSPCHLSAHVPTPWQALHTSAGLNLGSIVSPSRFLSFL